MYRKLLEKIGRENSQDPETSPKLYLMDFNGRRSNEQRFTNVVGGYSALKIINRNGE